MVYSSSLSSCTVVQEASECLEQEGFIDWLAEVAIAPTGPRPFFIARHRVRRQGDDRDAAQRRVSFDTSRGLPAIDHWQREIHENQIGVFAGCQLDPGRSVHCCEEVV